MVVAVVVVAGAAMAPLRSVVAAVVPAVAVAP